MARTDHPAAPTHRQHDGHSGHGGKRAKNKKNKKNKRKGEMLPQLGEQNSVLAAAGSPRLASSPLSGGSIGKKRKILSSAPDHQVGRFLQTVLKVGLIDSRNRLLALRLL